MGQIIDERLLALRRQMEQLHADYVEARQALAEEYAKIEIDLWNAQADRGERPFRIGAKVRIVTVPPFPRFTHFMRVGMEAQVTGYINDEVRIAYGSSGGAVPYSAVEAV